MTLGFLKKIAKEKERKSNNLGILAKMKDIGQNQKDAANPVNVGLALGNMMSNLTI